MNRPYKSNELGAAGAYSPEVPAASSPCSECDGLGSWMETVRCAGEAFDADWQEVVCEVCDGTGVVEDDLHESAMRSEIRL